VGTVVVARVGTVELVVVAPFVVLGVTGVLVVARVGTVELVVVVVVFLLDDPHAASADTAAATAARRQIRFPMGRGL